MKKILEELMDRFVEIHGVQDLNLPPHQLEFEGAVYTRPQPLRNARGVYLFFRDQE